MTPLTGATAAAHNAYYMRYTNRMHVEFDLDMDGTPEAGLLRWFLRNIDLSAFSITRRARVRNVKLRPITTSPYANKK